MVGTPMGIWQTLNKGAYHPVFNAFGTNRIMYGSDWPVCLVAGNYAQVKNIVTNYIADFSADEKATIMGKNAIQFYNL